MMFHPTHRRRRSYLGHPTVVWFTLVILAAATRPWPKTSCIQKCHWMFLGHLGHFLEMFGRRHVWRYLKTLHCFRTLHCDVRPSLAQKVHLGWKPQMSRKNFSNCCNPSKKKTWTTYHLGLWLGGFSQALAATTPVWNCSETDHPGTESCESISGKALWGHLIK